MNLKDRIVIAIDAASENRRAIVAEEMRRELQQEQELRAFREAWKVKLGPRADELMETLPNRFTENILKGVFGVTLLYSAKWDDECDILAEVLGERCTHLKLAFKCNVEKFRQGSRSEFKAGGFDVYAYGHEPQTTE